ncbi:MAG: cytochrome c peroxidase [Acidobacteriota bacterium]
MSGPLLSTDEQRLVLTLSPLPPPPSDPTNRVADDERAVRLGHVLFFDRRLSADERFSCADCHDPERGFSDGRALGEGRHGDLPRHVPSLWNVAWHRWYFWDGRADSLWMQALEVLEHPDEMAVDRRAVARLVHDDEDLRSSWEPLFGDLPSGAVESWSDDEVEAVLVGVAKCLAAYQRRLVASDSPFDRFVTALREGDSDAADEMSASAIRGLQLFVGRAGCRRCHAGPVFTDREFHDLRLPFLDEDRPDSGRLGGIQRYQVAEGTAASRWSDDPEGPRARQRSRLVLGEEAWGAFKTPGLRNVAQSPPYMHAGQLETLEDVVHHYSTLEGARPPGHHAETLLEPLDLSPDEQEDLVAFLEALSSEAAAPELLTPPGG